MKFLIGIVFLFIAFGVFGQEYPDSGFTNKAEAKNLMVNGLKEGKWCEYVYDNNLLPTTDSTVARYYYLTVYKAGKYCGIRRVYYKNGVLRDLFPYNTDGVINGIEKVYRENGTIWAENPWINGKHTGTYKQYFSDGKLMQEYYSDNGKQTGPEKWYYEDGTLESETYYTEGVKNGIKKEYYEDGKLKSATTFTNGEKETTKNYDENGNEIK
jgi:antitoxin component YwqK of YwqJK toxin-antitoxin module